MESPRNSKETEEKTTHAGRVGWTSGEEKGEWMCTEEVGSTCAVLTQGMGRKGWSKCGGRGNPRGCEVRRVLTTCARTEELTVAEESCWLTCTEGA